VARDPDDELLAAMPEIRALDEVELLAVHADPESAAITALLIADFVSQPDFADTVEQLARLGLARADGAARVKMLGRGLLAVIGRLGGRYLSDRRPAENIRQKAKDLRTAMVNVLEDALPGNVDARLWLDAIRRSSSAIDLVFDLRALANLYASNVEALDKFGHARSSGADPSEEMAQSARRTATILEQALSGIEAPALREQRKLLARIWTLFVPAYEDLCRTGRLIGQGAHEQSFPPLAMIVAHQRAKRRAASIVPPRPPRAMVAPVVVPPEVDAERDVELLSDPPDAVDGGWGGPGSNGSHADAVPPPVVEPAAAVEPAHVADHVDASLDAELEPDENANESGDEPAVEPADRHPNVPSTPLPARPVSSTRPPRQAERRSVQVEVGVFSDSNFYLGFTENISAGGVFIATYRALPIGSEVDVQLELPTGSLTVTGIVRWLRTVDVSEGWPGMGVQFAPLSEEDEARIREFVGIRDPLFFDD
jgi:uncharacterized protein (TIGR02266 family)